MNTSYGLRGSINPIIAFKGIEESFVFDDFPIEIKEGVLEIGFENPNHKEKAKEIVSQLVAAFSINNNYKYSITLDTSWKVDENNSKNIGIELFDTVTTRDRVVTNTISKGLTYHVVKVFDSNALINGVELVKKCQKDESFSLAVKYFNEEIIEDDKPLYGVFKALESLSKKLGGRANLANLLDQKEKYVDDVMRTANVVRHSNEQEIFVLSEDECKTRTRLLLEAYAKTIT